MWAAAAVVFVAAGIATLVLTEVVRSVVHRRRERVLGYGGTQDIAMWGTAIAFVCVCGAVVCGLMWLLRR